MSFEANTTATLGNDLIEDDLGLKEGDGGGNSPGCKDECPKLDGEVCIDCPAVAVLASVALGLDLPDQD